MIPYRTFPTIDVGPIHLHTFGLFVALGLLLGVKILVGHGHRNGIDARKLESLAWRIVLVGFVGARLMFVVAHLSQFTHRPWAIAAVWEGGLEFSGGFIAAAGLVLLWLRRNRDVPGPVLCDGVVLGLAAGLAVGRIGCYAVGEHLGGTTSFPLAVHYLGGVTREGPIAVGAHIHNTAVYEFLLLLPLIWLLFRLRRKGVEPGWLTATFLLWYGVQRFATDFLRAYDKTFLGLTGAQFVCIGLFVAGAILAFRLRKVEAPEVEAVA